MGYLKIALRGLAALVLSVGVLSLAGFALTLAGLMSWWEFAQGGALVLWPFCLVASWFLIGWLLSLGAEDEKPADIFDEE